MFGGKRETERNREGEAESEVEQRKLQTCPQVGLV